MVKKQIVINMVSNFVSFSIGLGISFFLTPFLIRTIGKEVYGFISLAGDFTSYLYIATSALNSMAARFITIKIYENDNDQANKYFNTVFFTNLAISILISIISSVMVVFLEKILYIPQNLIESIKLLFASIFAASILSLCFSVFGVATFCKNRLDLRSGLSIIQSLLRMILLIGFFSFFKPNIAYVGLTTLILVIIETLFNIILTNKLLPEIEINLKSFDINIIGILVSSGIWNSVLQLSSVLLTGVDLLIANTFLGSTQMSILAIAKILPNYIAIISSMVTSAFAPQFTMLYAKNDKVALVNELQFSLKTAGLLVNIPIAGIIVFGDIFFTLWLPTEDSKLLHNLSIIIMGTWPVSSSITPLYSVFAVTNNLKIPAVTLVFTGCISVLGVLFLLKNTSLGIFAVAGVSTVLTTCREIVFIPIYAAKCLNLKWTTFYLNIIRALMSTIVNILLFSSLKHILEINNWLSFLSASLACAAFAFIINIYVILNVNERKKFLMSLKFTFRTFNKNKS